MGNRMWAAILRYGISTERIEVIGKAIAPRAENRDANSSDAPAAITGETRHVREERRVVPAEPASGA